MNDIVVLKSALNKKIWRQYDDEPWRIGISASREPFASSACLITVNVCDAYGAQDLP